MTAFRPTRSARACTLTLGCAAVLGCGPTPPPPADASAGARIEVVLSAAPETLEDDVTLELARIGVAEVRARNDRGGELEPAATSLGAVDLIATRSIVLDRAVPATYSRVTLELAPQDGSPSFELRLAEAGTVIHVVDERPVSVDVRCDDATVTASGDRILLAMALDLGEVHSALRETPLPPAVDGVITIDGRAPSVLDAVESRLRERWHLVCGHE